MIVIRVVWAVLAISIPAIACAKPPEIWRKPAADMVAWFETSGVGYGKITPDFDCQGVSAGVLQWNVGKGSLWDELLSKVPAEEFIKTMPTYGKDFRVALTKPIEERLGYVRQFQTFANENSCNGNIRKAAWSAKGRDFSKELSALLKSAEVVDLQQKALDGKLNAGWEYATWWAQAKRGANASPTYLEFATFTDTLNFNGTWKDQANQVLVEAFRKDRTDAEVKKKILKFLADAPEGQYQRTEARKNAVLWKDAALSDEQLDLLVFAYLVATNLTKDHAVPFKLNTVSRRGTILLGGGWVNGEHVKFKTPAQD
ncbi:hypothetical protein [Agrobacterium sp. 10MFCol1.1]|uniref:hypothetical protein n=1 Tax=Agrobacterium sp. 10MFCol1.1 TaxID=1150775 RepID=UPI0012DD5142|nr:hypothetical protein [Agrobacterium sp. 10MFCol1.1]